MKKRILLLVYILCYFFVSAQMDTNVSIKNNTLLRDLKNKMNPLTSISDTSNVNSTIDSSEIFDAFIKPRNKIIFGIASFYSRNLEGTFTSTGEVFNHHGFTAASNNFALGTWVKVINLINEKFVVVRINDRMSPRMQKDGRVVDLSIKAASQLGFIKQGIQKVRVEAIKPPTETE